MVFYFEKRWRGITGPQKWQIPDDRCLVQKKKKAWGPRFPCIFFILVPVHFRNILNFS